MSFSDDDVKSTTSNKTKQIAETAEEYDFYEKEREEILKIEKDLLENNINKENDVICIELKNNNKIFLKYSLKWTIEDLILQILNHKEYNRLYNSSQFNINKNALIDYFDLELICFQKINDVKERKINRSTCLQDLFSSGILNNSKKPFLGLVDNRLETSLDLSGNEVVKEYKEFLFGYEKFLPRSNSFYFLIHNQDIKDLISESRQYINSFNALTTNPLVWPMKNWLNFNDESLAFLMKIENENNKIIQDIRFDSKGFVYSQDKLPQIMLLDEDYKFFIIEILVDNNFSHTVDCKLNTTAYDLLSKVNKKLNFLNKSLVFTPDNKILKVKNLSDYILDLHCPMGLFFYVYKSLREGNQISYQIIDNPFLNDKDNNYDISNDISQLSNGKSKIIKSHHNSVNHSMKNLKKISNRFTFSSLQKEEEPEEKLKKIDSKTNKNLINLDLVLEKRESEEIKTGVKLPISTISIVESNEIIVKDKSNPDEIKENKENISKEEDLLLNNEKIEKNEKVNSMNNESEVQSQTPKVNRISELLAIFNKKPDPKQQQLPTQTQVKSKSNSNEKKENVILQKKNNQTETETETKENSNIIKEKLSEIKMADSNEINKNYIRTKSVKQSKSIKTDSKLFEIINKIEESIYNKLFKIKPLNQNENDDQKAKTVKYINSDKSIVNIKTSKSTITLNTIIENPIEENEKQSKTNQISSKGVMTIQERLNLLKNQTSNSKIETASESSPSFKSTYKSSILKSNKQVTRTTLIQNTTTMIHNKKKLLTTNIFELNKFQKNSPFNIPKLSSIKEAAYNKNTINVSNSTSNSTSNSNIYNNDENENENELNGLNPKKPTVQRESFVVMKNRSFSKYKQGSFMKSFKEKMPDDKRKIYDDLRKNNIIGYLNDFQSSTKLSQRLNDYYLKLYYSNIDIESLDIPFRFSIKEIILNDISYIITPDIDFPVKEYLLTAQLFIGKKPISKQKTLLIKNYQEIETIKINKVLSFDDILFAQLPSFSSIIFTLTFNDNKKNTKLEVGWLNYRLFDHKRSLKTGYKNLIINKSQFNDTSFFSWEPNLLKDKIKNYVFIQFPSFSDKIHKFRDENSDYTENIDYIDFINKESTVIKSSDKSILDNLRNISPFDELNLYEKSTLWFNRYYISKNPELIPRLIQCINFKNVEQLDEINKVLSNAKLMTPVSALQLLTGEYLHEEIRNYAIKCISKAPSQYMSDYLIQLIQALKYEQNHYSDLAKYLLSTAINYPTTLGHSFFWALRSEMHHPEYQQRFGLLLEAFLSKIGSRLCKCISNEIWLVEELLKVADIPFNSNFKGKSNDKDIKDAFILGLNEINSKFNGRAIPIPVNFNIRVVRIISEKCKIMKSKKKPLWIVFETSDGSQFNTMFKKGDDLRQDILTLQLFKTMQNIWFENKLKLKMSIYNVVSTGYFQGMLEMVENSETLAHIHKIYGGAKAAFSKENLNRWFEEEITKGKSDLRINFKLSCAAYCISTFVLGIGDRHNDNIMIKKNGELFHIDFGHFLGHFKYKYGIKRETAPFIFTKEFKKVLGGSKSSEYKDFRRICLEAYLILRRNSILIVSLLRVMLCCDIPELSEESIKFIEQSLCLKISSKEDVEIYLDTQFTNALTSLATKIMFAIHVIAN